MLPLPRADAGQGLPGSAQAEHSREDALLLDSRPTIVIIMKGIVPVWPHVFFCRR
jgi:hypothetical protein